MENQRMSRAAPRERGGLLYVWVLQSIGIDQCYRSLVDDFTIGNVGGRHTGETRVSLGAKLGVFSNSSKC